MSYEQTIQLLDIKPNHSQDMACRFLENRGLRFCVDFGVLNAEQKMALICQDRFTEYDFDLMRSMGIQPSSDSLA